MVSETLHLALPRLPGERGHVGGWVEYGFQCEFGRQLRAMVAFSVGIGDTTPDSVLVEFSSKSPYEQGFWRQHMWIEPVCRNFVDGCTSFGHIALDTNGQGFIMWIDGTLSIWQRSEEQRLNSS